MNKSKVITVGFICMYHITLALMLIDWACHIPFSIGPIGVYEVSYGLLGILFLMSVFGERKSFVREFLILIKENKTIITFLALYVIMGIITLLYANNISFSVTKYVVVVQMILFLIMSAYYILTRKVKTSEIERMNWIMINLGVTAIIVAIISVLGFMTDTYTVYKERISPIIDYNQYSTILLVGFIAFSFVVLYAGKDNVRKYIFLLISAVCVLPAIYVSGSRRSYLLMMLVSIVLIIFVLVLEIIKVCKKKEKKHFLMRILLIVICICVTYASVLGLEKAVQRHNIYSHHSGEVVIGDSDGEIENIESTIEQTYDSISDGQAMSKRSLIWSVAIEDIQSANAIELLVGHGASYAWEVYDQEGKDSVNVLLGAYGIKLGSVSYWMNPHNVFLQDMLDGGILLVGLQVTIWIFVCISLIKLARKNVSAALSLFLMYLTLGVTLMLSCAHGVVAHKYFWLFIGWQVMYVYATNSMRKKDMDEKNI